MVVGSGAGGAPAAARLAEAGFEVLVLEAGPRLSAADFSADEAAMTARLGRATATASGAQSLYAGACVGGSTVVNDALCWRTPPEVLERWRREHGLSDLTDAAFAPFVDAVWEEIHAETTPPSHLNRNARRLELGAQPPGLERRGDGAQRARLRAPRPLQLGLSDRCQAVGARQLAAARRARGRARAAGYAGHARARLGGRGDGRRGAAEPIRAAASRPPRFASTRRSSCSPPACSRPRRCCCAADSPRAARSAAALQFHSSVIATARFAEPVHGYFGPTMSYADHRVQRRERARGPGLHAREHRRASGGHRHLAAGLRRRAPARDGGAAPPRARGGRAARPDAGTA